MNNNLNPEIYVACLSAYNSGCLHGAWIDATMDESDIYSAIQTMLSKSPVADAQEWAIHDYTDFGNNVLSEHSGVDAVQAKATFIKEHGSIAIALLEYYGDLQDAADALEDFYRGEWNSELDFATEFFHEMHHDISDNIRFYIDYDAFRRDLFINDFFSLNVDGVVHVFSYH